MRHINDQTLDQLLADSLDEPQERELETHVQQCVTCAARLREWETLFPQIRGVAPASEELGGEPEVPATRSSVVMLPDWTPPAAEERPARARPNPLWILVAVLAAVATWLAVSRRSTPETASLGSYGPPIPTVDSSAGGLGSGLGESAHISTLAESAAVNAVQPPAPDPVMETGSPEAPTITPSAAPNTETTVATTRQDPVQFPVRVDTTPSEAPAVALPTEFTRVTLGDAIDRLGGPVRLIDGLRPETVEIAGGSVLPGADPAHLVVRIIFDGPEGRIILDQQRLGRPGSREPDVAISTAPSGVSVAQWIDWKGYWISLACRTDQQSLLAIANRIHESP
ncbi:MAG: hypothetical protein ABI836_02570 [Gemmatimonadota bacterium]